jgi:hypothetical protein
MDIAILLVLIFLAGRDTRPARPARDEPREGELSINSAILWFIILLSSFRSSVPKY